jgi:hypothetical protein
MKYKQNTREYKKKVGVMTRLLAGQLRTGVRFAVGARYFSPLDGVHTGFGAYLSFCPVGSGIKDSERKADHASASNAQARIPLLK